MPRFSLLYELKRICDRETELDDESLLNCSNVGLFEREVEFGESLKDETLSMLEKQFRCNMKPKKIEEIAEIQNSK